MTRMLLTSIPCAIVVAGWFGPYAWRDGDIEASGDIADGKPVVLYTHVADGVAPGYSTPNVEGCRPDTAREIGSRKIRFVIQPELGFHEGEETWWWQSVWNGPRSRAAYRFAKAYNAKMVEAHRGVIEQLCPGSLRHLDARSH